MIWIRTLVTHYSETKREFLKYNLFDRTQPVTSVNINHDLVDQNLFSMQS